MVYISTSNLTMSLRQSVMQTQSNLATAQKEVGSGVYADLGLQLGGQASEAISLAQQSGHLTALTAANGATTTRLSATSSAIDSMMTDAQNMSNTLLSNASAGSITQSILTEAQGGLQALISSLNTSVGNQFVFAGTNTSKVPMSDYTTNQSTVDAAVNADLPDPSTMTGAQMQAYLSDSSTNFAALYQSPGYSALSSASSTALTSQISPSQTITTSVSATQTAFQNIAQAYSMLSEFGGKSLTADASSAVITAATTLLNKGLASLTTIQANVGAAQSTISTVNDQMSAQQTILTNNVNNLEDVDTYSLSTKINSLSTQLQDAYSLTNQLKSLSLVTYLTGG